MHSLAFRIPSSGNSSAHFKRPAEELSRLLARR